jgi:hypothetical protein
MPIQIRGIDVQLDLAGERLVLRLHDRRRLGHRKRLRRIGQGLGDGKDDRGCGSQRAQGECHYRWFPEYQGVDRSEVPGRVNAKKESASF